MVCAHISQAQNFNSTKIEFQFEENPDDDEPTLSNVAEWSFEPLGATMMFSEALDDSEDGLYIFRIQIRTNGFWPGTSPSFGIASYPLFTSERHILGYVPGEWGYLGTSGNKVTESVPIPWGLPVSDIGDELAITYDTESRELNFYVKRANEPAFTHAGGDAAYTLPYKMHGGKDYEFDINGTLRFAIAIYSFRGCSVEIKQAEFVPENTAPRATNVSISGDLEVGQELIGTYNFTDAENDDEEGTTFQWYRSDDDNGTGKTTIVEATSSTYTLTSDDLGKYISFEVRPGDGTVVGDPSKSSLHGPIALGDITTEIAVFLEGAFNGTDLNTTLNSKLPLTQPYNNNGHNGGETANTIPANAVDWILVELREAADATSAIPNTRVGSAAGFLMNDGSIKDLDGTSNLRIVPEGNLGADFFVVIYHRNHLPIMSATAISSTAGIYSIDFTSSASNAYQGASALADLGGGKFGLISGDADGDGEVDDADLAIWRSENGTAFTYGMNSGDFNLDAVFNPVDRNAYLKTNKDEGKTTAVPVSNQ